TFTSTTGTVTFAAGSTKATVTITPTADTVPEPDETVILTLTSGTGYNAVSPTSATGTILNDDTNASIAVSPASVGEASGGTLTYTFTLNQATPGDLTVTFPVGGTATFGSDYTQTGAGTFSATSGTVTILNGQSSATVTITPVNDSLVEPDETVQLTVTAGTGYGVGAPSPATGTINDDEHATVSLPQG